jgi:hypothetical protein
VEKLLDIISTYLMQILQLGIKQNNSKVQQKLHGVTHFSRIQTSISSDPLAGMFQIVYLPLELFMICILSSLFFLVLTEVFLWAGLYVTASGFDSEILSLQRKFGQWREDGSSEEHNDLLFYEYVEAVKLTGDNLVPAGQV